MFPFKIKLHKKLNKSSSPNERANYIKIIEDELKSENYNSLKEVKIIDDELKFKINYFATGSSNFMAMILKGNFLILDGGRKTIIYYTYYIGGGFIHFSILSLLMTICAIIGLQKPLMAIVYTALKYYVVIFIFLWLITLATEELFFNRIIKKLKGLQQGN